MRTTSSAQTKDPVSGWIEDNFNQGKVVNQRAMGSSGWSSAYCYETDQGAKYFVKLARGRDAGMFKGEALGLQAMYATQTLRIPNAYHCGELSSVPGGRGLGGSGSFIIMEYLNFGGTFKQEELGRQLAEMHMAKPHFEEAREGRFGFPVDNTIGGTPQPNPWTASGGTAAWVAFFKEHRLQHMLQLAGDARLTALGNTLCANLEQLFDGVEVTPSVLHGDLWSGNVSAVDGQPAIYDPAVYFGHAEAEFGMSWCAGFSDSFYRAYHSVLPKAKGFEARKTLYKLYHYLNHYVLFGSGYYSQCLSSLTELTRTMR
ncbi:hypothetical protein WJX72_002613 [[Myrmecia] bisecta]|uniref:protein-ribulosamine 3-kinase n=1 Tax=[Myrmecia] bisecta TaxID=41462 RepID=A0AAW1QPR5_9CHLO